MSAKAPKQAKERNENTGEMPSSLTQIRDRLDLHGEMLRRILQILTEEKEGDGPTLSELLADLIRRIDVQTRTLADLTTGVLKLGQQMPLDIVRAIDDNLDPSERKKGGRPNGNGREDRTA